MALTQVQQGMVGTPVAGTGPAFSAYASSAQSLGAGAYAKIQLNATEFDTASCFNTSTYRFTPNVAGYYQFNTSFGLSGGNTYIVSYVYKNGSSAKYGGGSASCTVSSFSTLIYANGTTDYFEFYVYTTSGGPISTGTQGTWMQGYLARAA